MARLNAKQRFTGVKPTRSDYLHMSGILYRGHAVPFFYRDGSG